MKNNRKTKLLNGEIQSFIQRGHMNPCKCGSNCYHKEYDGKHLYGVCNACHNDIYEFQYSKENIKDSEWSD